VLILLKEMEMILFRENVQLKAKDEREREREREREWVIISWKSIRVHLSLIIMNAKSSFFKVTVNKKNKSAMPRIQKGKFQKITKIKRRNMMSRKRERI
jgi:hypothetical protein